LNDNTDILKKLKISYIDPKFIDLEEFLKEGYELYKDNAKIHKKKAAEEKKIR